MAINKNKPGALISKMNAIKNNFTKNVSRGAKEVGKMIGGAVRPKTAKASSGNYYKTPSGIIYAYKRTTNDKPDDIISILKPVSAGSQFSPNRNVFSNIRTQKVPQSVINEVKAHAQSKGLNLNIDPNYIPITQDQMDTEGIPIITRKNGSRKIA